jgi:hypothetical protein
VLLRQGDFPTKTALRKHIEAFLERWNQNPTPLIWTKKPHRLIRDHRRMLALISYAPHYVLFRGAPNGSCGVDDPRRVVWRNINLHSTAVCLHPRTGINVFWIWIWI